jgi:hypothetical protein
MECILFEWVKACRIIVASREETFMFTLSFADDQVHIAEGESDLEFMLNCQHRSHNN